MDKSMLPSKVESLWMATTPETNFPELDRHIETDVAIVGGGIAGLNVAFLLKRKGLKVVVIDSTYIAAGTSGNTTAKITSQHHLKYAFLKNSIDKKKAQIYADSNQWAIKEYEKIIKKENIGCDFHHMPSYVYATTKNGFDDIKKEFEVTRELNLPSSIIYSADNLSLDIFGAIRFDSQAYFHPRKYLLAIAGKINTDGCYIFEKTTATDIQETEESCKIITDKKNIKAKYVIIATNFPFYSKEIFSSQIRQELSYVFAVRLNTKIPEGMFIGLNDQDLSFRPHVSGKKAWMTVGAIHHFLDEKYTAQVDYEQLYRYATKIFDIKSVDYKWAAQDSYAKDRLPYIGFMPKSKRVLVTTGYSAWGMTTSLVSAKLLSDLITGKKNEWESLYSPSRIKKANNKNVPRAGKGGEKMDLKPNEGKIVEENGEKLAVYKDESGKVTAVSAICTHMGCTVGWNNKDKTWDCPCHGSRYDKTGKVIHGPAVKNLSKKEIEL